jgi:hypothetical protein
MSRSTLYAKIAAGGAAGAMALAGAAAPAAAQSLSENPIRVTWDVGAPRLVEPLSFRLSDRTDLDIAQIPIRVRLDAADPAPSAASGAWRGETHFQACATNPACAGAPGRVGLRVRSDGYGGVKLGALVRIGENLSEQRAPADSSWRFFAAADAHAITWDFDRNDDEGVRVEDKMLVGDAQLGVARPVGGGDLALGFIHREVSAEGASRNEQFGGVTFTMQR